MVELAKISQNDLVLEIGTGNGDLTKILQQYCGCLVSVEVDKDLYSEVKNTLKFENLVLLNCDILVKKQLNPVVVDVINHYKNLTPKIVSNPPYHIISPLLEAIISCPITFREVFLTVQKEIADRLTANAGSPGYSSLSVFIKSFCKVTVLKNISRHCFFPVPQVDSAFIYIKPYTQFDIKYKEYSQFLKRVFSYRRKNMKNVFFRIFSRNTASMIIQRFGIKPSLRPEDVEPITFKQIYYNFYS